MPLPQPLLLLQKRANSGPKVSTGYSANFLNLPYTLPSGLRVQASIACYLIKALNASHSLSRRADTLDNERAEARKGDLACRLQLQEVVQERETLKEENEKLKIMLAVMKKEKKEA
ncbi:hypothetical protein LIER_34853 [Lithospermum erythrorhizon]|uniref:Uncharacterized protein n=1 Tax=Lithospermum erythrorhizon TaxID=34254 RepID=A0AAV3S3F6_LITER